MPPKKPLAALTVVEVTKAPKLALAHGKMELMERLQSLSGGGERFAAALFRIIDSSDNEKTVLAAIELGLRYMVGDPIKTSVAVDMTSPVNASQAGQGVKSLTTAQLEALASGEVTIEGESEEVLPPDTMVLDNKDLP